MLTGAFAVPKREVPFRPWIEVSALVRTQPIVAVVRIGDDGQPRLTDEGARRARAAAPVIVGSAR